MDIEIRPVESKRDVKKFIHFQYKHYKQEPNWVPYLLLERYNFFNQSKNPFYKTADMQLFIALRNRKVVGRIAAIVNHQHIKYHKENVGFFGFYEAVDDQDVADALLDAAAGYLREKGMETIRGPMNPSTNGEVGFLTDAFDRPPVIMMPYNFPYYNDQVQAFGMEKVKDVYAILIRKDKLVINPKLKRVNQLLKQKNNITLRKIRMDDFEAEVQRVKEIYNDAWSLNWGFIPMIDEEFEYMAHDLKQVIEPELVLFAEKDGVPAGFSLSLPDVNQILIHIRNGRLFPFGVFKFLLYKNKVNGLRVLTLGVKKKYEYLGLGALFYLETIERGLKLGYEWAEASWVLEDNLKMIRPILDIGGEIYKTYRIYEKKL
jgi:hypothetical protein